MYTVYSIIIDDHFFTQLTTCSCHRRIISASFLRTSKAVLRVRKRRAPRCEDVPAVYPSVSSNMGGWKMDHGNR